MLVKGISELNIFHQKHYFTVNAFEYISFGQTNEYLRIVCWKKNGINEICDMISVGSTLRILNMYDY